MTPSPNTVWHQAIVTRERREAQNGHKSCAIWFIGKPWCGHDGFYIDDRAVRPRGFLENSLEQLNALLERDRLPS